MKDYLGGETKLIRSNTNDDTLVYKVEYLHSLLLPKMCIKFIQTIYCTKLGHRVHKGIYLHIESENSTEIKLIGKTDEYNSYDGAIKNINDTQSIFEEVWSSISENIKN